MTSNASRPGARQSGAGAGFSARHLVRLLAECDAPCPSCGYSLFGLRAPRCPECGSELELGVSLAEPRLGAFIAGLIPLIVCSGFCGIVLLLLLLSQGGGPWWGMLPLIVGTLGVGGLAWLWIAQRRRLRRRAPRMVARLAAAAWLVGAAPILWFLALVI